MSYRVGVDVGGTFTDFLLVEPGGTPSMFKVLSTPANPSDAVLEGLAEVARSLELPTRSFLEQVEVIVHGTTITTNAVLTGNGARTALLTTKGFRDIFQMRNGLREDPYNNNYPVPTPLVPRYLRHELDERVSRDGDVVTPLDEAQVRQTAGSLPGDVDAIAVCLMHSYANIEHERRAAAILRKELPDCYVSVSHEILPAPRLYDRTSTTVLNSYVGPIMSLYLRELGVQLQRGGFNGVLLIMQSNGGVSAPDVVVRVPATTFLSGPASGPRAALLQASRLGYEDCITVDMGGTSFDACLVRHGVPLVTNEGEIGRWRFGLPLLDIHTIGAGGGSIARVEGGRLLAVGPTSAGASPGPACYGRGGQRPTVTDADLVLGYLSEEAFFGGRMRLSTERAAAAIEADIARPLGVDVQEAAAGIYDLVCTNMAEGIREVTVKRGYDPREFPLIVAGGAGPVHAGALARLLEIPIVLIPRESSIFCAAGMLIADFQHDYVRSYRGELRAIPGEAVRSRFDEMVAEATQTLTGEYVPPEQMSFVYSADMRYVTQWYDVNVRLPAGVWEEGGRDALAEEFQRRHDDVFGYVSDESILVTALRVSAIGGTDKPHPVAIPRQQPGDQERVLKGRREEVYMGREHGFAVAVIWDGDALLAGAVIEGPALIEMATTTIVVLPEYVVVCDEYGNFRMVLREREDLVAEAVAAPADVRQ